ncbi:glycosyltransferase family 2 protein [Zavarzinella formosa]|uniref:glycosyltransferase family 2 protein n=1 Tax=Zavarzinella formosa TaxID=360055 RepID=UPI000314EF72|nr:hypothetical protein [Zavarzinella formosa]
MPRQQIVLVVGTGRCGMVSLLELLGRQAGVKATLDEQPLLPWQPVKERNVIAARLERMRRQRGPGLLVDAGSFYLPYLEDAIRADPSIRILAMQRPREEVVASFERFLDGMGRIRIDHWSLNLQPGLLSDPLRSGCFPQYDVPHRADGIRRYWQEYGQRLDELVRKYPQNIRICPMRETLYTEEAQRAALEFARIPRDKQVVAPGVRSERPPQKPPRPQSQPKTDHPLDPGRCAVLVPYLGFIHPPCENGLRELERRGYVVRRAGGFSAIDQGRNQLATEALLDGFEETMWIDSDVEFSADHVDRLRSHGLPLSCGLYPQKGPRALACHVMPGTRKLVFGRQGGLNEMLYVGAGFLHIRREVYLTVQKRMNLPTTNERFGSPSIPFFQSMLHPIEDGLWYLAEDYSFCERARQSGYRIVADTTIRLWHHGAFPFGWEDSGIERERTATFTLHFGEDSQSEDLADPPAVAEEAPPVGAE